MNTIQVDFSTDWHWDAGAFSWNFIINMSPQCRAFSKALKTEKLKPRYFPAPLGRDYKILVPYKY